MKNNPNEILVALSRQIGREVVASLGDDNVESIFVTGSVARGEAAGYVAGGFVEVYSDVDVAVVVDDAVDLDECRMVAKRIASAHERQTDSYRVFPVPDVGVFTHDDLRAQRARPGTVDMDRARQVIFGSDRAPEGANGRSPSGIDRSEALYLLEHRLLESREVCSGTGGEGHERYAHYVTLKNGLDAVSAILIGLGKYEPSREERLRVFWREETQRAAARLLSPGAVETIRACEAAMRDLQGALVPGADDFAARRLEVDRLLLRLWKSVSDDAAGRAGEGWYDAIRRRTAGGTAHRRVRELMVLARRRSVSRPQVLLGARRLARFSPVDTLRLIGLIESLLAVCADEVTDARIEREFLGMVDGLTRRFGFREGSLFRRGREMYRAIT
ncbi:MAG: hypothetical protein ACE5EO_07315 [Candidatus Krumholzibacteriia bacterium]